MRFLQHLERFASTLAAAASGPSLQTTPLKREIQRIQQLYPSHVLLCQIGSFYEIYDSAEPSYLDDTAAMLGIRIAQLKRTGNVSDRFYRFAGFPVYALKNHMKVLLQNGKTIALVDQVGKHKLHDQMIRRVTRIVTPGTVIDDMDIDHAKNNFLLSVYSNREKGFDNVGLAYVDVSTGEFYIHVSSLSKLEADLARIDPREILVARELKEMNHDVYRLLAARRGIADFLLTVEDEAYFFDHQSALKLAHIGSKCNALEFSQLNTGDELCNTRQSCKITAAIGLMSYLSKIFPDYEPTFHEVVDLCEQKILIMDSSTVQSLEISKSLASRSKNGSLLDVIDCTLTAPGFRLLSSRLQAPSADIEEIKCRHDGVQLFFDDSNLLESIRRILKGCKDIERSLQRLQTLGSRSDFISCIQTLEKAVELQSAFSEVPSIETALLSAGLGDFKSTISALTAALSDGQDTSIIGTIKSGYSEELDRLRDQFQDLEVQKSSLTFQISKEFQCQVELKEDSHEGPHCDFGRPSMAVKDRIESRLENKDTTSYPLKKSRRPAKTSFKCHDTRWNSLCIDIRAQEQRILELDSQLFRGACKLLVDSTSSIIRMSRTIAEIDFYSCLAFLARRKNYVRPIISNKYAVF